MWNAERGSLLVVTLWLIAVLAMVSISLAGYLSTETRLMRYDLARAQAKAWARAGVYLAMQRLAQDDKPGEERCDWLGDDWASAWVIPLPAEPRSPVTWRGHAAIQITDEERRIDLNIAKEETLATLIQNAEAARAVVDYRDPDDEGVDATVQPPYAPKNAPIRALEELWEIPRISQDAAVQSIVRQHGGLYAHGAVNINTVGAEVLEALDGDRSLVEQLIRSRPGPDGVLGSQDDCKATTISTAAAELASCAGLDEAGEESLIALLTRAAFDVRSSVFRILVVGETEQPSARHRIEAVVRRGSQDGSSIRVGQEPFAILAWKEG
jgi:type II secretory pathway component PulK